MLKCIHIRFYNIRIETFYTIDDECVKNMSRNKGIKIKKIHVTGIRLAVFLYKANMPLIPQASRT
jgi:hypothetical protein